MCQYTVIHPVLSGNCSVACQGCQWDVTVTATQQVNQCVFDYRVVRSNCAVQSNETFTGTVTVPCDGSALRSFPCDPNGLCIGLRIEFTAHACPSSPSGGGPNGGAASRVESLPGETRMTEDSASKLQ